MYLDDLFESITDVHDVPHVKIGGLCCDSRKVMAGDLFFALPGTKLNGSQFVVAALKGGASAIVSQEKIDSSLSVPEITVKDIRAVLAKVAARFYGDPTQDFYLCGITGTNGKTTITYLLESMWGVRQTGVIGTINYRIGGDCFPSSLTTPDAITVQKIFSDMVKANISTATIEASSHALEQRRVHDCQFDSAVFTNLTQDHLDYHGDMETYYQSKLILFKEILSNSVKSHKLIVVNRDDEYGLSLIKEMNQTGINVQTFSVGNKQADIFLENPRYSIRQSEADIVCHGARKRVVTNLLGEHNMRNLMAAVLVGLHQGKNLDDILNACKNLYVPGRLQRVLNSNFFVDYAHTPDALKNVLSSLKNIMKTDPQTKRLIVVFGCGGDRDRKKRPLMGEAVGRLADVALITSDNPRTEDPLKIIEDIVPGVAACQHKFDGDQGYLVEADRRKALEMVVEQAGPQDVVVVAGKGHEDYQILGTKKIHFDDAEILAQHLATSHD